MKKNNKLSIFLNSLPPFLFILLSIITITVLISISISELSELLNPGEKIEVENLPCYDFKGKIIKGLECKGWITCYKNKNYSINDSCYNQLEGGKP